MIIDTDQLKEKIKRYYIKKVIKIGEDDTISEKAAVKKLNLFERWEKEETQAVELVERLVERFK